MFKSLDRKKVRLFIDVLFACLSLLDQELSPFFYNGGRPLVSILKQITLLEIHGQPGYKTSNDPRLLGQGFRKPVVS